MLVALLLLFFSFFLTPSLAVAADQNFTTPVFPIRGREYWREGRDLSHFTNLKNIVLESKLPATWLIHYDVLADKEIIPLLQELPKTQEIGLFLEVTRDLAEESFVLFDWENDHWSSAHKLFLSGYSLTDRQKIIDHAFNSFKNTFGYYPKSYGSWYTDVYSMEYIKDKYDAKVNLGLADQYSTDGYQTWGQYIDQPYFVSKKSAIEPAQDEADSTGVLKVLWAPREPTLSFGDSVEFSNFSLQVNDYNRSKRLPHSYFEKLLKDLTVNSYGPISQVVVGVEVAEVSPEFYPEIARQLTTLANTPNLTSLTLSSFEQLYRRQFSAVSPAHFLKSTSGKVASYWYMSPHYRFGLFQEDNQLILKDLRFYHQNLWRDNDQVRIDPRHNLSRLVPALIDQIVYHNQLALAEAEAVTITKTDNTITLAFSDKKITLSPSELTFNNLNPEFLKNSPTTFTSFDQSLVIKPALNQVKPTGISRCYTDWGGFAPPAICLKTLVTRLHSLIPDLRYSYLHGQRFFGLKTGPETLLGLRLPALKVGTHRFDFPVLENFISLRKKLDPKYSWFGKQEFEISAYQDSGEVFAKEASYGQDNLRQFTDRQKLFENGYYYIFKP